MKRLQFAMLAIGSLFAIILNISTSSEGVPASEISWKKTILDKKFRSEGVGIADINHDQKADVIAGDVWYEAPDWKIHQIRKATRLGPDEKDATEGHDPKSYSKSFCCFPDDFNGDGWADVIVIPFPGEPCYWYENPQNKAGHWKPRMVWRSACNETPLYADLFGDGKKYLVMAIHPEDQMCWFSVPKDIEKPWDMHPISGQKAPRTGKFAHGLGVGDVNGDGRNDLITVEGWWEQPADAKTTNKPWEFHKASIGEDCADMYAFDVDGDRLNDVISSSAHRLGLWWHQQLPNSGGIKFKRHNVGITFSQTHALHFVDINGDGRKDLVTGKRWWAHGPTGDVDPGAPAVLHWIEIRPGAQPSFAIHKIDDDSGIGTQFAVGDVNGDRLPDIAIANKKGAFVFEQVRGNSRK